jgi:hypothetical protein
MLLQGSAQSDFTNLRLPINGGTSKSDIQQSEQRLPRSLSKLRPQDAQFFLNAPSGIEIIECTPYTVRVGSEKVSFFVLNVYNPAAETTEIENWRRSLEDNLNTGVILQEIRPNKGWLRELDSSLNTCGFITDSAKARTLSRFVHGIPEPKEFDHINLPRYKPVDLSSLYTPLSLNFR